MDGSVTFNSEHLIYEFDKDTPTNAPPISAPDNYWAQVKKPYNYWVQQHIKTLDTHALYRRYVSNYLLTYCNSAISSSLNQTNASNYINGAIRIFNKEAGHYISTIIEIYEATYRLIEDTSMDDERRQDFEMLMNILSAEVTHQDNQKSTISPYTDKLVQFSEKMAGIFDKYSQSNDRLSHSLTEYLINILERLKNIFTPSHSPSFYKKPSPGNYKQLQTKFEELLENAGVICYKFGG